MSGQQLVEMANDIATFFAAEPDPAVATLGIESHLRKFWSQPAHYADGVRQAMKTSTDGSKYR